MNDENCADERCNFYQGVIGWIIAIPVLILGVTGLALLMRPEMFGL